MSERAEPWTNHRVFDGRGELWNVINLLRTRRRHAFRLGERIHEPNVPDQWHRVRAVCDHCGEQRAVYWAVSRDTLNIGPCRKG